MTVNQLFKKRPTIELVLEILKLLKINNLEETKYKSFSKNDITQAVLSELENKRYIFQDYYIKCKYDIYFTFLDQKKVVTILRQCLKAIDYKLTSRKEYISGKRIIVYSVLNTKDIESKNVSEPLKIPKSTTIVFD
jgi:hypothetical protein